MKVGLMTTGLTEWLGLPGALGVLFPEHQFVAIEDRPGRPFHGFTSCPLPVARVPGLPSALDKLVAHAVSLADPDTTVAWDLVVLMDDLELANRSQPAVVCSEVRKAVERHVDGLKRSPSDKRRLAAAVRRKVSFHLAVPMIESWFFAAPTALSALGIGNVAFHRRPGDPEKFESTDRAYVAADSSACTKWCAHRRPKADAPKWIRAGAERVFHPKGYLQWLMLAPAHKTCTAYREGQNGAAPVLAGIDWDQLIGSASHMPFARSLVDDLADGLAQTPSVDFWAGATAPLTCRTKPAGCAPLVLRNL